MKERRICFFLNVVYNTSPEKVEVIPILVKEIIEKLPGLRFDRAHFKSLGKYSLEFEVVYYVLNSDYNFYMDVQQKINLTLFKEFNERGIEFAYPTQTMLIEKGDPNFFT